MCWWLVYKRWIYQCHSNAASIRHIGHACPVTAVGCQAWTIFISRYGDDIRLGWFCLKLTAPLKDAQTSQLSPEIGRIQGWLIHRFNIVTKESGFSSHSAIFNVSARPYVCRYHMFVHQYPEVSSRFPFVFISIMWNQVKQETINKLPVWERISRDCPGPIKITPTRTTGKGHFSQCLWKVDAFWVGGQPCLLQWCKEGWVPSCSSSQTFRHIHLGQWNVSLGTNASWGDTFFLQRLFP